jgi:hypothetical protein
LEITQLADNVSENRVTRILTQTRLERDLFAASGRQVLWGFTSYDGAEAVYQFATDPIWDRIVYSRRNSDWIKALGEWGSGQFAFDQPLGIDVDMDRDLYVADYGNQRLVFLWLDDISEDLVWLFCDG